jgi:hypothetical protein
MAAVHNLRRALSSLSKQGNMNRLARHKDHTRVVVQRLAGSFKRPDKLPRSLHVLEVRLGNILVPLDIHVPRHINVLCERKELRQLGNRKSSSEDNAVAHRTHVGESIVRRGAERGVLVLSDAA